MKLDKRIQMVIEKHSKSIPKDIEKMTEVLEAIKNITNRDDIEELVSSLRVHASQGEEIALRLDKFAKEIWGEESEGPKSFPVFYNSLIHGGKGKFAKITSIPLSKLSKVAKGERSFDEEEREIVKRMAKQHYDVDLIM